MHAWRRPRVTEGAMTTKTGIHNCTPECRKCHTEHIAVILTNTCDLWAFCLHTVHTQVAESVIHGGPIQMIHATTVAADVTQSTVAEGTGTVSVGVSGVARVC